MADTAKTPITHSLVLSPDLDNLTRVREFVTEVAEEAGFATSRIFDIALVSSEAAANAIEHAPVKDRVRITTLLYLDRLEIQVEGPGEFQTPDRLQVDNNRGLGLPLMAKLSDHLALYSAPHGGTLVTLTFYREGHSADDVESPLPPTLLELLESSDRLESLVESIPAVFAVIDAEERWSYLNGAAVSLRGRSKDEIIGESLPDTRPDLVKAGLLDLLREAKREGRPIARELYDPARDEWSDVRAFPLADGAAYFRVPINERKQAEARLERQRAVTEGINRIYEAALTAGTERELGKVCLEVAERLTESRFSFVGEIQAGRLTGIAISDPARGTYGVNAFAPQDEPARFEIQGIYGRVVTSAETVLTNDPPSHGDSIGLPPEHPPLTAFLGTPLTYEDSVIGMIAVGNREGGYTAEQARDLEALAPSIVQAFLRKRAEEALKESRAKYQTLLETSTDFVWEMDTDARYTYCGPQMEALWGMDPAQMQGRSPFDLMPTEDRVAGLRFYSELVKAAAPFRGIETRAFDGRGNLIFIEISGVPMLDNERGVVGFRGTTRDITEQKRAAERVSESEARLRSVLDNCRDVIYRVDLASGEYEYISGAVRAMTGFSASELMTMDVNSSLSLVHPDDVWSLEHARSMSLRTGEAEAEYRQRTKSGEYRWLSNHMTVLRDAAGVATHRIGTILDITEHRQAREALEESERRYRDLYEHALSGMFATSVEGRLIRANQALADIFLYDSAEQMLQEVSDVAATLYADPADRDRVLSAVRGPGRRARQEVRIKRRDGSTGWILLTFRPVLDAAGSLVGYEGGSFDITDRKRVEQELSEKSEQAELLIREAPAAVYEIDFRGPRFVRVNDAMCAQSGYSREELLQMSPFDLLDEESRCTLRERVQKALAGRQPAESVDYTFIHKDGHRGYASLELSFIHEEGRPVRAVVVGHDVTERRKAEEALRESEQRYRTLFDSMAQGFCVIEVLFEKDRPIDYRIIEANEAYQRHTGREHSVGRLGREMSPDLEDYWFELYGQVVKTGEPVRFTRRAGPLGRYLEVYAFPVGEPELCHVGVLFSDVTERVQAEQAIKERDDRLSFALQVASTGAWDLDLSDHTAHRSPEHDRIFGYDSLLPEWTYEMFMEHVLPEDRAEVDAKFQQAVACRGDWSFECRIRRADGAIRWIWAAGRHRQGSDGGWRLFGIVQDITERKLAEDQRRLIAEQEREIEAGTYARSLIEASLDPLVTIGPDGKISDVNEATVEVTGWARDELIGTDFCDYFTDPESARRGYERAFALGSVSDYPLTIRDRSGKLTDVLYNASVYRDREGMVLGVFAAARDITAIRELKEQRDIASTLQHALFDIPKEREGVRFAHLYRSATEAAKVGGDFYDVFEARGGKLAILIGDVSGHGVEAARTATLVKDVIHAFAHQSLRTHEVLRRTNNLLIEKDLHGFVTLFLAILDVDTGVFGYSSAGHPDALLRRASGEIELLGNTSSPLGVYPEAAWKAQEARLAEHDLLFMYTDGVIDARRNGEFFGEKRLGRILRRKRATLDRLPHMVIDQVLAFSGGHLRDDIAILALSLAEQTTGA